MDCELKNRLYELSKQRRIKDIIDLTESIVMHRPQDLAVRYCAGIAKIYDDDFSGGLAHLNEICELYENLLLFKNPDIETKRFVGQVALQLAALSEFHTVFKLDNTLALKYSNKAAVKARLIAHDVEDLLLRKEAESMLKRHLVWCIRNESGCVEGGIYPVPKSPFVLQVEPTNNCDIKCLMCPRHKMARNIGYLDEALLDKIISGWSARSIEISIPHLVLDRAIIKNWKVPGVIKFYYMGEPLLHPGIDTLISKIRQEGIYLALQTNGFALADCERRKKILEARPSGIWFSVDGFSKESYESVRKGSSWNKICRIIKTVNRERKEMGLEDQIKLGITSVIPFSDPEGTRKTSGFLSSLLPLVDYSGFSVLDRRLGGSFFGRDGKLFSFKEAAIIPGRAAGQDTLCPESLEKLNILCDGTITPCCYDVNAEMELGNAKDCSVDAVWSSERMKMLQCSLLNHRLENLSLCQFCKGKFQYAA